MSPLEALLLGIVQGLTEFLPVSSSGHLVLVPRLLGWASPPLIFDASVHLATLIAVVAVLRHDLRRIITAWWLGLRRGRLLDNADSRLGWWIILGTVPGVLVGLLLAGPIESLFASTRAVGGFLLLTAALLALAELVDRRQKTLPGMTWLDSLLIGIGQAAAIAPGLSRSGTTLAVGMFRGMTREASVRFSFLLSIPIIAGAGLVQVLRLNQHTGADISLAAIIIGGLSAAVCGYASVRLLLAYLRKRPLFPFAIYCAAIGILALLLP